MSWRMVFTPKAKKELQAVPAPDRVAIYRALKKLSQEHPNLDIKKLWAEPPQWRLRVGNWRIVYTKSDSGLPTLTILNVFNRKEGY